MYFFDKVEESGKAGKTVQDSKSEVGRSRSQPGPKKSDSMPKMSLLDRCALDSNDQYFLANTQNQITATPIESLKPNDVNIYS